MNEKLNDVVIHEDILAIRGFSNREYVSALERALGNTVDTPTENERYVRVEGRKYVLHIDLTRNNGAERCRLLGYGAQGIDVKAIADKAMRATRQYFR